MKGSVCDRVVWNGVVFLHVHRDFPAHQFEDVFRWDAVRLCHFHGQHVEG